MVSVKLFIRLTGFHLDEFVFWKGCEVTGYIVSEILSAFTKAVHEIIVQGCTQGGIQSTVNERESSCIKYGFGGPIREDTLKSEKRIRTSHYIIFVQTFTTNL